MLTFCLAFLLVIRIPWALGEVLRLAIGPVNTDTWLAFAPMEAALGLAVTMVLAASLLAAAIDWLLGPSLDVTPEPDEPSADPTAEPTADPAAGRTGISVRASA